MTKIPIARNRITVWSVLCDSGKLLIAYTMYNSTRCYGIPFMYTVTVVPFRPIIVTGVLELQSVEKGSY